MNELPIFAPDQKQTDVEAKNSRNFFVENEAPLPQKHRPKVIWLMPSPATESILLSFCLIAQYVNTSNHRVDCAVNYSSNL